MAILTILIACSPSTQHGWVLQYRPVQHLLLPVSCCKIHYFLHHHPVRHSALSNYNYTAGTSRGTWPAEKYRVSGTVPPVSSQSIRAPENVFSSPHTDMAESRDCSTTSPFPPSLRPARPKPYTIPHFAGRYLPSIQL